MADMSSEQVNLLISLLIRFHMLVRYTMSRQIFAALCLPAQGRSAEELHRLRTQPSSPAGFHSILPPTALNRKWPLFSTSNRKASGCSDPPMS